MSADQASLVIVLLSLCLLIFIEKWFKDTTGQGEEEFMYQTPSIHWYLRGDRWKGTIYWIIEKTWLYKSSRDIDTSRTICWRWCLYMYVYGYELCLSLINMCRYSISCKNKDLLVIWQIWMRLLSVCICYSGLSNYGWFVLKCCDVRRMLRIY